MKALGKILGLFLLGLLLIVVALLFALTHLFDPNDYKDEIRQIAHNKANLDLQLKGDIGWSLFPWLGLELTDATLGGVQRLYVHFAPASHRAALLARGQRPGALAQHAGQQDPCSHHSLLFLALTAPLR